jgi:hypothetical protein
VFPVLFAKTLNFFMSDILSERVKLVFQPNRKILKEAEPSLKEALEKYPDFNLVVTGHSLGAGTAELVSML